MGLPHRTAAIGPIAPKPKRPNGCAGAGAAQVQKFQEQVQVHHPQHSQPSTTRHSATATKACLRAGKAMSCRWSLTQSTVSCISLSWAAPTPKGPSSHAPEATRISSPAATLPSTKPHVRKAAKCATSKI